MAAILATKLLDTTSQSGFKAITTCILSLDYVGTNYGGPQLSRQNLFTHDKINFLTAKSISPRQNQFRHGKINFATAKSISPRQSQFDHGKINFTIRQNQFYHGKIIFTIWQNKFHHGKIIFIHGKINFTTAKSFSTNLLT